MQTEKTKISVIEYIFDVVVLICTWVGVAICIYEHNWFAFAGWFAAACYKTGMMIDK